MRNLKSPDLGPGHGSVVFYVLGMRKEAAIANVSAFMGRFERSYDRMTGCRKIDASSMKPIVLPDLTHFNDAPTQP